jgi:hypothetical protein
MQLEFFSEPAKPIPPVQLLEHASPEYAPRTGENARGADITVAFATDFTTAGERLTRQLAGKRRYLAIPYGIDANEAAAMLATFMRERDAHSLNVAGNGAYTLAPLGATQERVNQWVFDVLKRVHAKVALTHVRSGGQTGIDTAGLVAGLALGVPITGLYPRGFRQRLANRQDITNTAEALEVALHEAVTKLHTT